MGRASQTNRRQERVQNITEACIAAMKEEGTPITGRRVTLRVAQAMVNAMLESGVSPDDVTRAIGVPHMLADIAAVRVCGEHSGIPMCCIEYFVTDFLPKWYDGEPVPPDDVPYFRCPTCRQNDVRITMKSCDCYYIKIPDKYASA